MRRSSFRSVFDDLRWLTGRHRIQRVPPNDKKGRRQSSEVTVVAIEVSDETASSLDMRDVKVRTERGSGKGGQHRNVTDSKVVATHVPTGLTAQADSRSQHQNRQQALAVLAHRVAEYHRTHADRDTNAQRRSQASGELERAFTWTEWRDTVVSHLTGRKAKFSRCLKGQLDSLR